MPPKRPSCANPIFYKILIELRDAEEIDTPRYMAYNKAARSLKAHPEVLATADDAQKLVSIGPKIVGELKKRTGGGSGATGSSSSGSAQRKSAGTSKSSVDRPRKSSSTASIPPSVAPAPRPAPTHAPASQPAALDDHNSDTFQFCYLTLDNDNETRVRERAQAHVEIDLPSGPGLLIEYPRSCQHPILKVLDASGPRPNRMVGYLPMDIADVYYPSSTLPLTWTSQSVNATTATVEKPVGIKRAATTSDLLAEENDKMRKKQKSGGLDPSRQVSYAGTWTVSSSGSVVSGQGGPARGVIQRSQTMPNSMLPPPSVLQRSSSGSALSSQGVPAGGVIQRSQPMPNSMLPPPPPSISQRTQSTQPIASSSQIPLQRTESVPKGTQNKRNRPRMSQPIPRMEIDIEDPYASTDPVVFDNFVPKIIKSSDYEIVLLLDNREVKSGVDRSGMLNGLLGLGIPAEQRPLGVGDVCWIAKRIHSSGEPEYDEIVLDCVLERKRLDDLVDSVKDGRFHEQKYRLHGSAITNVYYLVEQYKIMDPGVSKEHSEEDKTTYQKSIATCISQTSIIDRFKVRQTSSIKDTIKYYATLHQAVKSKYKDQNLYVIPSHMVKRHSYLKFQKTLRREQPDRSYLLSYKTFSTLNSKSGFVTVRESFARMLLCIPNMSPEKAGFIIERHPTFASLYDACRQAERRQREDDEDERIGQMRSEAKPRKKKDIFVAAEFLQDYGGNSRRRIGPALSRDVYTQIMHEGDEYPERG
ncbi:hypothetical protein BDP27DRAFT_777752 [Rhodocollybia butyracea]|uniref:Crossover junction endonuclease MUS81 n=1 Tax=Rhodocollybia butyracea TaxID=206335 RepID=A0A9P5U7E9_9AGAR|nr:hypothetical protein BDP27DRAFT_777752 [Rhodocollybia butyracea]